MEKVLRSDPAPVLADAEGVMRVRGTRVTLDSVLAAFWEGATAEEIAQRYPSVSLADVYQVIGHYLSHSSDLESYLARRQERMRATRQLNEGKWPPEGIRDRLLARRQA